MSLSHTKYLDRLQIVDADQMSEWLAHPRTQEAIKTEPMEALQTISGKLQVISPTALAQLIAVLMRDENMQDAMKMHRTTAIEGFGFLLNKMPESSAQATRTTKLWCDLVEKTLKTDDKFSLSDCFGLAAKDHILNRGVVLTTPGTVLAITPASPASGRPAVILKSSGVLPAIFGRLIKPTIRARNSTLKPALFKAGVHNKHRHRHDILDHYDAWVFPAIEAFSRAKFRRNAMPIADFMRNPTAPEPYEHYQKLVVKGLEYQR